MFVLYSSKNDRKALLGKGGQRKHRAWLDQINKSCLTVSK